MRIEKENKDEAMAAVINFMEDGDGFVFVAAVNGATKIVKYNLSAADITANFELAKFAILMGVYETQD